MVWWSERLCGADWLLRFCQIVGEEVTWHPPVLCANVAFVCTFTICALCILFSSPLPQRLFFHWPFSSLPFLSEWYFFLNALNCIRIFPLARWHQAIEWIRLVFFSNYLCPCQHSQCHWFKISQDGTLFPLQRLVLKQRAAGLLGEKKNHEDGSKKTSCLWWHLLFPLHHPLGAAAGTWSALITFYSAALWM